MISSYSGPRWLRSLAALSSIAVAINASCGSDVDEGERPRDGTPAVDAADAAVEAQACTDVIPPPSCGALRDRLIACDSALETCAWGLALAGTETEIVVAWLTTTNEGPTLRLTRYSPDFVKLSEADAGPITACCIGDVSLAPYGAGWAVAISVGQRFSQIEVHAFDADGVYRGLARRIERALGVSLIGRPSGPPLLVYGTSDSYSPPASDSQRIATVLSADLTTGSPPVTLGPVGEWLTFAAIFIGNAFLFADTVDYRQRTGRIELDGSLVAPQHDLGPGAQSDHEVLALTNSGPVLVYAEDDLTSYLVHLDDQGAPTASVPLAVTPGLNGYRPFASMLGFESDVLLPMSNSQVITTDSGTTQSTLKLLRIDAFGQILWQTPVASSAPDIMYGPDVVQVGRDVVVGWLASSRELGLAKIRP